MGEFRNQLKELIAAKQKIVPFKWRLDLQGCTQDDILDLMQIQKVSYLPPIYQDFLLIGGIKADMLFIGSDFTLDRVKVLKEAFKDQIEVESLEDTEYRDIFVFMDHQGYVQYFFYTDEREPDPVVYVSMEGNVSSCECLLSEFLLMTKQC